MLSIRATWADCGKWKCPNGWRKADAAADRWSQFHQRRLLLEPESSTADNYSRFVFWRLHFFIDSFRSTDVWHANTSWLDWNFHQLTIGVQSTEFVEFASNQRISCSSHTWPQIHVSTFLYTSNRSVTECLNFNETTAVRNCQKYALRNMWTTKLTKFAYAALVSNRGVVHSQIKCTDFKSSKRIFSDLSDFFRIF